MWQVAVLRWCESGIIQKVSINTVQKCHWLTWAWNHLRWTLAKSKRVFCSEKQSPCSPDLKGQGKPQLLLVPGQKVSICHGMEMCQCACWVTFTFVRASLMQKDSYKFSCNICSHLEVVHSKDVPEFSKKDNAKPHSVRITSARLQKQSVQVLDWPACCSNLSPVENAWHIIKGNIWQGRPWTTALLKNSKMEELEKFPCAELD